MKTFKGYIQLRSSPNNPTKKSAQTKGRANLYYVLGRSGRWNGVSCYAWADNAEQAKRNVKNAIDRWASEQSDPERQRERLKPLRYTAEKVPVGLILEAGEPWAGNSGYF